MATADGAGEALGWTGRVMQVLAHVSRLLAVQGLWALGVLAGCVVLGVHPASVAAVRALEAPSGLTRAFWAAYRGALVRANLVGAGFTLATALVVLEVLLVPMPAVVLAAVTVAGAGALVAAGYAVVAQARVPAATARAVLRFALLAPWASPWRAVGVLCVLAALALAIATAPAVALLFGASAPLLVASALIGPVVARAAG
ncbi:DUF624 domain-containing protein [Microbacterium gilvum]|uniref:DUF624 domain-containing protein n=1 Tax=Microbacterium gilvum TaxID=1336204 RepID=A0ABP9AFV6_9MICO